jgi:hypothetical protein
MRKHQLGVERPENPGGPLIMEVGTPFRPLL